MKYTLFLLLTFFSLSLFAQTLKAPSITVKYHDVEKNVEYSTRNGESDRIEINTFLIKDNYKTSQLIRTIKDLSQSEEVKNLISVVIEKFKLSDINITLLISNDVIPATMSVSGGNYVPSLRNYSLDLKLIHTEETKNEICFKLENEFRLITGDRYGNEEGDIYNPTRRAERAIANIMHQLQKLLKQKEDCHLLDGMSDSRDLKQKKVNQI